MEQYGEICQQIKANWALVRFLCGAVWGHKGGRAFPSHGRGRRFNPYSAHHFSTAYRQLPAVAGRTIRKHAGTIGGESVDSVRGLSAQRPSALSASTVTRALPRRACVLPSSRRRLTKVAPSRRSRTNSATAGRSKPGHNLTADNQMMRKPNLALNAEIESRGRAANGTGNN